MKNYAKLSLMYTKSVTNTRRKTRINQIGIMIKKSKYT